MWAAVIVGAIVGAYLGGSAANDNFNPFQWDWSSGTTWTGIAGGAVMGAISGASWGFALGAGAYASTLVNVAAYTVLAANTVSAVTTIASLSADFENGMRIMAGRFYLDPKRKFWGGMLQGVSHFTWEGFQNWVGYNAGHSLNFLGQVDRVDYFGGAMFLTNENASKQNGVSLGNTIIINYHREIDSTISFEEFVLTDPLYMHEYGHTFQSDRSGFGYLFVYGIPSLISASKSENGSHRRFWTENSANRWARRYFEWYGVDWNDFVDQYPLR